jgi:hypothetical protein
MVRHELIFEIIITRMESKFDLRFVCQEILEKQVNFQHIAHSVIRDVVKA